MSMLMGRVLGDRGEYAAARERLEQAAAVAEQSPALHIVALGSLHELVRLSRTQAYSTRASSYLDSATKLAQGLPKELQHGSLSELWEQRAWVLLPRDPLAAKQAAQRALDLLDSAPETTASLKAQRLLVLGVCTQAVDGAAAAHPILHRALQLLEAAGLGDTPQAAKTLAALVGVLKQLGHLEEAEAAEEQALSIGSRKLESRAIAAASRLTNLAAVREAEGRLAEAKELLEQARDLLEARYGHDHGHLGTPLYNLGLMLLQLGDREGARACAERALKIFERVHGPDHPYSEASRALTFLTLTPESMEAERAWERFFSTGLTLYAPELGPGAEQLRRALVFVRSHHAHPAEVSNALSEALRAAEGQEDFGNAARAALLLGSFLGSQGAWETAQEHIERALRLARRAEHPLLIAEAYRLLGDANLHGSYYEDARLNYAEAIRRYEELGFKLKAARTRLLLLTMLVQLGRAQEIAPLLPSLRQALDAGVFTDTQERTDAEQALRLAESLRGAHPQGDTP
jgi:tetratricopeptide (TPR) repeat protein